MTSMISPVDRERALAATAEEGGRLVGTLRSAGDASEAAVPTCPGWSVHDMGVHLGIVYAWVALIVSSDPDDAPGRRELPRPVEGETVADYLAARLDDVLGALGSVPESALRWNFVAGGRAPVSFWWRRQLHETAIHRVDAELATGQAVTAFEPVLAADGVSEYLELMGHRECGWDELEIGDGFSIHLHATDLPEAEWTVDSKHRTYARAHLKADVAVRGPAWSLMRWCWGRIPAGTETLAVEKLELFGDAGAAESWRPSR